MISMVVALAFLAAVCIVFAAVLRHLFDIQKRIRADHERTLAERRSLFDNADAALIVHSSDGSILEANRSALELFGLPDRQAALAMNMADFSARAEAINPILNEYWRRAMAGETPSFETLARALPWQGGTAILATIRDLSQRKTVEKERDAIQSQLYQVQKLDALSRLAGGFAGDFNNALTGVMGTLSVLRMLNENPQRPSQKEVGRYILTAIESCARAGDLVRQLLTISRREDTKLIEVDVKETLSRIVQICRNSFPKSISIDYREGDPGPLLALGDQAQLDQAILNVCINAYQAMTVQMEPGRGEGGELCVEIGRTDPDVRQPGLLPDLSIDRHYARISIKDTGVGISSEAQKRLFEPFFTTKSKEDGAGLGLGLSIVYSIMKRHSGSVEISSTEGRGTVVSLYLPLLAPRGAKAAEEADQPPTRGEGLLLVVDDENAVRISAEGMLKLCGYSVLTADSGQAGIDVYKDRGEDIALVLLDVSMPGKSGIDAMREIRAIDPAVKIVMMSGFVENEGINQAIGEGALAFLRKPFTMRYLSKMVKSVLDAPNAGA
jgi:PAS domain S-box-containing protein